MRVDFRVASPHFTVVRRNRGPFVHIPVVIIAFLFAGQLDASILSDERHLIKPPFPNGSFEAPCN